jgi:hypothetical protein
MDLQGDIDTLLRDSNPSPFGPAKWKDARPEELQRLVMMRPQHCSGSFISTDRLE